MTYGYLERLIGAIIKMNVKKVDILILFIKITAVICAKEGDAELYVVKERDIRCIKCNIGEYVAGYCTEDLGNSTCEPCAENEYVSDGGATSCAVCMDCKRQDDKTVEYIKCTKSEDTVCVCPPEQIFEDGLCQKCPDNYIVDRTKSDVDGKCMKCESGSFYDNKTESCTLCSSCGDDEDIVAHCGGYQDTRCESVIEIMPVVIFLGAFCLAHVVIISVLAIKFYKLGQKKPISIDAGKEESTRPLYKENGRDEFLFQSTNSRSGS